MKHCPECGEPAPILFRPYCSEACGLAAAASDRARAAWAEALYLEEKRAGRKACNVCGAIRFSREPRPWVKPHWRDRLILGWRTEGLDDATVAALTKPTGGG